jgi:Ca-activated chloride channel family protein
MLEALRGLRPADTFRIIRFSDAATEFSSRPLSATPANIAAGIAYTRGLYGSGGTMMTSGIRQALSGRVPADAVRNVVFLTDGYIGNEASVLELVEQLRGDARLFAFGVGSGVNRYLLGELGRVGHGFTRYFDPTRDAESAAQIAARLAARLQTPVLTNLDIDWDGLPVTDVLPRRLPDLYAGDTLRITGRFTQPAAGHVQISGRSRGQSAQIKRALHLGDGINRNELRRVWARTAIAEHMHSFITPVPLRADMVSNSHLQAAVTELGLNYGLATRWTSFVAVSRQVYNPQPGNSADAQVALPQVAGVSQHAYTQPALTGFGTPEPGMLLSLLTALLALVTYRHWRRGPGWR